MLASNTGYAFYGTCIIQRNWHLKDAEAASQTLKTGTLGKKRSYTRSPVQTSAGQTNSSRCKFMKKWTPGSLKFFEQDVRQCAHFVVFKQEASSRCDTHTNRLLLVFLGCQIKTYAQVCLHKMEWISFFLCVLSLRILETCFFFLVQNTTTWMKPMKTKSRVYRKLCG